MKCNRATKRSVFHHRANRTAIKTHRAGTKRPWLRPLLMAAILAPLHTQCGPSSKTSHFTPSTPTISITANTPGISKVIDVSAKTVQLMEHIRPPEITTAKDIIGRLQGCLVNDMRDLQRVITEMMKLYVTSDASHEMITDVDFTAMARIMVNHIEKAVKAGTDSNTWKCNARFDASINYEGIREMRRAAFIFTFQRNSDNQFLVSGRGISIGPSTELGKNFAIRNKLTAGMNGVSLEGSFRHGIAKDASGATVKTFPIAQVLGAILTPLDRDYETGIENGAKERVMHMASTQLNVPNFFGNRLITLDLPSRRGGLPLRLSIASPNARDFVVSADGKYMLVTQPKEGWPAETLSFRIFISHANGIPIFPHSEEAKTLGGLNGVLNALIH